MAITTIDARTARPTPADATRADGHQSIPHDDNGPANIGFLSDERLARLEHLFDRAYRLPGTDFRFGLDGIFGLIPGIGDAATAAVSSVIVADAWKSGARKRTIARMARNVGIDFLIGSIPLVGDLFDFGYKANTKNIKLLRDERNRIRGRANQKR